MKLTTLILLATMSCALQAADKFAYINSQQLLEQSPQANALKAALQEEFGERDQKLRNLGKSIQEMEQTYVTDRAIMSDEQKQKAEENINFSRERYQFEKNSLDKAVQARQRELLQRAQIEIRDAIQAYGKAQGYDFIFSEPGIVFASDAVDITDEVLQELKK